MKKATSHDKALVLDLLTQAFDNNLSVNYVIKQDNRRSEHIRALMEYSFETCFRYGEVWLTEDGNACVLLLFPHQKRTTLSSIWLDIKLIFNSIGFRGIGKAMKRESLIKSKQPKIPMIYLWFIGVNPLYQHRQTGSRLLTEVLAHAGKHDLPVYLETSTERNLPWYEKHGFIPYDTLDIGYKLYFLKFVSVN